MLLWKLHLLFDVQYLRSPASYREAATPEQVEEIVKKYAVEKPKNPSVEETETEIDKELAAVFTKKKRRDLELYAQGSEAYENNRYKESIALYDAALEISETASFHFARGNSYPQHDIDIFAFVWHIV